MVKYINLSRNGVINGSYPVQLTNVNGTLFFADGGELWRSNGAAAGTLMLKDIKNNSYEYPAFLTNVNGTLFFSANDSSHGTEALAEQRRRCGHCDGQGHQPRRFRFGPGIPHQRERNAVLQCPGREPWDRVVAEQRNVRRYEAGRRHLSGSSWL